MISLRTNMSSFITQNSLTNSTNKLNQAIERMSTGYKINHASDNAASYSISRNMDIQISACDVAADNIAMGIDLLQTVQDTISGMQERGSRIQALMIQARNGTYGTTSLAAMTQEASALMSEINRLYSNAEYNGINLFDVLPDWAKEVRANAGVNAGEGAGTTSNLEPKYNGFIDDPVTHTQAEVDALTHVSELSSFTPGQKYQVSTKEDLIHLAELVNSNKNITNVTFVMGADIDLSSVENWTPIGDYSTNTSYLFKGTFDGNGHVIKNFKIDNPTKGNQGLFGSIASSSTIKNVGIEGANVTGQNATGGLVGSANSGANITNSYATGVIKGGNGTGGFVGGAYGCTITNSYAIGSVIGTDYVGGLVGYATGGNITNNYATGSVTGSRAIGGLVGSAISDTNITNSYASSTISGTVEYIGGLVGYANSSNIANSYATGNVTGTTETGGLVGLIMSSSTITNSYATGSVNGSSLTGGLVGSANSGANITNSYATGAVTGTTGTGGLVGFLDGSVMNSYATGNVTGTNRIGGLVGFSGGSVKNSYATGDVTGSERVGGLIGEISYYNADRTLDTVLAFGNVSGDAAVGGLIGSLLYKTGSTSAGTLTITNASVSNQSGVSPLGSGATDTGIDPSYDLSEYLENITVENSTSVTLQVGINGDESSQINFGTFFNLNLNLNDLTSDSAYNTVNDFMLTLSARATEFGAVSNRLESALNSIEVNINNLTVSHSTIKDADIAKESSAFIKSQILQQAAATLMSTANQSPSIALQLI